MNLEGIVPTSFGSKVLNPLKMAFSSSWSVLEFLVAIVAIILPQWHSHFSLPTASAKCIILIFSADFFFSHIIVMKKKINENSRYSQDFSILHLFIYFVITTLSLSCGSAILPQEKKKN